MADIVTMAKDELKVRGKADAAALAARMVRGDSLAETARWAVGAGALACEAETTINPAMSWDNIETILNRR